MSEGPMQANEEPKDSPDKVLSAFLQAVDLLSPLNEEQRRRIIMSLAYFYGVIK